jgi:hypothetical protein
MGQQNKTSFSVTWLITYITTNKGCKIGHKNCFVKYVNSELACTYPFCPLEKEVCHAMLLTAVSCSERIRRNVQNVHAVTATPVYQNSCFINRDFKSVIMILKKLLQECGQK